MIAPGNPPYWHHATCSKRISESSNQVRTQEGTNTDASTNYASRSSNLVLRNNLSATGVGVAIVLCPCKT